MAFIDYRLSTSSKKSVVIPFRCCSNNQPVYILTSVNGWNAIEMTKIDTVDSDKHVHLYEHTVIVPGDVSNFQYKFRVGEDLYLHDGTEDTSKFDVVNETKRLYSLFLVSDGFGGLNNTFEVRWDPIYSISTHEPNPEPESSVIETPSGPGSLQVSEEEPAPVGISQMPSIDLPAASGQESHSIPASALRCCQTLSQELVSITPGTVNAQEVEELGHTSFEKVGTITIGVMTMDCRRFLEQLRAAKKELRKLHVALEACCRCSDVEVWNCVVDIIKDAVRHRTLSERLYGPSKLPRIHLRTVES